MADEHRKNAKTYHFHSEWEHDFLFTLVKDKPVCLICHQSTALSKNGNLERHRATNHGKFKQEYLPKSALRTSKVMELKTALKAQQQVLTKQVEKNKAATEASFHASQVLAKHKKPFTDEELFKEAMSDVIKDGIDSVPLGPTTVARRIESLSEDVSQQLISDLSLCECFSLKFDKSVDMTDTAQLMVFARMTFEDLTSKEAFLTLLPLKERTGARTFSPSSNSMCATTDGAPAMIDTPAGFIALHKDPDFPVFVNYHCVIHHQALASKVVNFSHLMTLVTRIVNSIQAKGLQHRLLKSLLDEVDAVYGDLLLHAEVRWLSRGKVLQRFIDLLPESRSFLESRKEHQKELPDSLNEQAQHRVAGKDRDVTHMINTFKAKLGLWISQAESDRRFQEIDKMEDIVRFISNPFIPTDTLTAELQVFSLPNGVDMEITELQNDTELQERAKDRHFWGLVNREKFPLLSFCAVKVKPYFGSTYLCEGVFSRMKIIKSKHRTRLTDRHLADCVRLGVSSYDFTRSLKGLILQQKSH
uniref:SPIN-DOC-like zinc-finger domain-containing protein n=1 Tax=Acanthochromis polyacanthus TaxID=80966 RepID=A0A3Q1F6E5_9TELE